MFDRNFPETQGIDTAYTQPNLAVPSTYTGGWQFTETGFTPSGDHDEANTEYIYIAFAENAVAGDFPPTGTLAADADDSGPTMALTNVEGVWEAGMKVVNDTTYTQTGPGADVLEFVGSIPSATGDVTQWGNAIWTVTNEDTGAEESAAWPITDATTEQKVLASDTAIGNFLEDDTIYNVRVAYSSDTPGAASPASDSNRFKTAGPLGSLTYDGWYGVTWPEVIACDTSLTGNFTSYSDAQEDPPQDLILRDQDGVWKGPMLNKQQGVNFDGDFDVTAAASALKITGVTGIGLVGKRPEDPPETATGALQSLVCNGVEIQGAGTSLVTWTEDPTTKPTQSYPTFYAWANFFTAGTQSAIGSGDFGTVDVVTLSDMTRYYDINNSKVIFGAEIEEKYGIAADKANLKQLGIAELTEQSNYPVAAYVEEGDKYKPIRSYEAQLNAANARVADLETAFLARIAALEADDQN